MLLDYDKEIFLIFTYTTPPPPKASCITEHYIEDGYSFSLGVLSSPKTAGAPLALWKHHLYNCQAWESIYLDAVQLHHRTMLAVSNHSCLHYFSESCFLKCEKHSLES